MPSSADLINRLQAEYTGICENRTDEIETTKVTVKCTRFETISQQSRRKSAKVFRANAEAQEARTVN